MKSLDLEERIEWSAILVVITGTFMAGLNGSIINVALPKMMSVFGVSVDAIQWVITSYMLTTGIVMATAGYLGDVFGYRKVYIMALGLFVLGSLFCGISWNLGPLIAGRILQALGGGLMQPIGMALIYMTAPRSKIGLVLGVWGIAAMAAPTIGPTLGGYIIEVTNWRVVFYANIPVALLAIGLAMVLLKETPLKSIANFDRIGILLSAIGLFCLLYAMSEGNKLGWGSPEIVILLLVGIIAMILLVWHELRHPSPVLDFRLFKNFTFALSTLVGSILFIGIFGATFFLPILLQNVLGQTAMHTGLILFPGALVMGLMMPISGRIFDKSGGRSLIIGGIALATWTTYMMHDINGLTPFWVISAWLAFRAVGIGLAMMPVTTTGMNAVPVASVGLASSLGNVSRQVAVSFGIAMFTAFMQNRQAFHYGIMAQSINLNSPDLSAINSYFTQIAVNNGLGAQTGQVLGIGVITQYIAKQSMINAISDCFIVATVLCALALILGVFLKKKPAETLGSKKISSSSPTIPATSD
ncbi:MAG: MFS transporter [Firmicutes bacterium HGW-Firmicutes-15]|nr:MAG: MFS transporter [Firmicutes bacterium HGW-Firmicutes-15]